VPRPNGADAGERRLQLVLGLLLIGLTVFTAIVFFTPLIGVSIISLPLDLMINTGAMLVAGAVSGLAWVRYRETAEPGSFFQASAFLTLAAVNAVVLALIATGVHTDYGFSLGAPGALPVVTFVVARLVAALLLLVGGMLAYRQLTIAHRWPGWFVLVPPVVVMSLMAAGGLAGIEGAPVLTSTALDQLRSNPGSPLPLTSVAPGVLLVQLFIGVLFLGGAWLAYRAALAQDRIADAYLASGLVLAGFSQVHLAVNPGSFASLVTTGDLLRVAFYAVLLAGIFVQSRADVAAIRRANVQLAILRDADVNRAMLEERARLAREVHDGLAQDLWYARLKQGRLIQLVAGDERTLAEDVANAIDSGIADARQAVMAMRASSTDAPLFDVLADYLSDFGDRFALKVELETAGERPELSARVQAEVLRVVQEALNNTRKHADATAVRVRTATEGGRFRVDVVDNGRGFRAGENGSGFGLKSMQQRAELVGGELHVTSALQDGTKVSLMVPLRGATEG
jgi:signal transduction histidine kinase